MSRRAFMLFLQTLILISPLPFGFVGRVITPVFYLLLLIVAMMAIQQGGRSPLPLFWKPIRLVIASLFVFVLIQILPMPWSLVKVLSPATVRIVSSLRPAGGTLPSFHSISLVPMETLFQILRWLCWLIFFYALLRVEFDRRNFRTIFHTILGSGLLQVAIAFIKYASGNRYFFIFFYPNPDFKRDIFLTGTIANPDHFSFYLELIFPIAVALFLTEFLFYQPGETFARKVIFMLDENKKAFLYLLIAVVLGAGIILTGSRAGIMAFVISILVFISLSVFLRFSGHFRRKIRYIMMGILLLVILIGFQDTLNKFISSVDMEINRFTYWTNSLHMTKDFLIFGCGFGTFKFGYFLYDTLQNDWLTHAHNEYVETLAEGGIIGLILWIVLVFLIVFSMWRMWARRRNPEVKIWVLGVLIACLAAALHLAFEFALRIPANSLLLFLLIIMGLKIASYRETSYGQK